MRAEERRRLIMERLYQRREDTVPNLAQEFGVCKRTIESDIQTLSLTHPIETIRGRHGGGIRVMDGCYSDRRYLTESEQSTLECLCTVLEGQKLKDVRSILRKFAMPH